MKVLDAGVVVGLLTGDLDADLPGGEELVVPHLLDSEVLNVLRRLALSGHLTDDHAAAAVEGFLGLGLTRYSVEPLRVRIWALRHTT